MGQGAIDYIGVKGGLDINGIIENYYVYAGENISAGNFVEFINGVARVDSSTSSEIQITTRTANYGFSAIKITENKFVIFGCNSSSINWAVVGIFENASIQLGTPTNFPSGISFLYMPSGAKISDTSVIFIGSTPDSNTYLCGIVGKISGLTISFGSVTTISSTTKSNGRYTDCINCSANKVFITHENNSRLYGIVCTISDVNITTGTDTNFGSESIYFSSLALLEENKVFIASSANGNNSQINALICTISNTTITCGSIFTIVATDYYGLGMSVTALTSNKVVLSYGRGASYNTLHGIICSISETTITNGTNTLIYSGTHAWYTSITKISESKAFVSALATYTVYGTFFIINNMVLSAGELVTISTNGTFVSNSTNIKNIMLQDNNSLVVWRQKNSYYPSLQLWNMDEINNIPTTNIVENVYETQVRKATSVPCNGVAKTSGIGGDETAHNEQVEIYVPDI